MILRSSFSVGRLASTVKLPNGSYIISITRDRRYSGVWPREHLKYISNAKIPAFDKVVGSPKKVKSRRAMARKECHSRKTPLIF